MKNKYIVSAMAWLMAMALWPSLYATDLIVEENGVSPNFATIQAAVTAAGPGDRVFVKNKAGNVPYQESVTINKSLSLLAYDPDGLFYVFGSYTITPVANGEINIIGMNNNSGSISASAAGANATPTRVNVLGSNLVSGSISMAQTGFVTHVAGCNLFAGSILVRTCTVTGNLVNGSITVSDPGGAVTGYPEDTLYIVGNRVMGNAAGAFGSGGIAWANASDYCFIANNAIRFDGTGISVTALKLTAGGTNVMENNSWEGANSYNIGINIAVVLTSGSALRISNNAFNDTGTSECCSGAPEYMTQFTTINAGAVINLDYNVIKNFINGLTNASTVTVSQTGNVTGGGTFDAADVTGICTSVECINLGNPSTDYTDLDLTRNDVGVSGGSYNSTNFWPNQTGGARVYLVKTPRTVVQSSTINAKADSFDR